MKKEVLVMLKEQNAEGLVKLEKVKQEYKDYIIRYMKENVNFLLKNAEELEMKPEEYLLYLIESNENISYYQDIVEEIYKIEKIEKTDYIKQFKNKNKSKERNK